MGKPSLIDRAAALGLSVLGFSALLNAAFAFWVQFLLVRLLPPHDYGTFSASVASIALIASVAGFGLPQFWLRLLGESQAQGRLYLRHSIQLAALTSAAAIVTTLLWAVLQPDPSMRGVLLIIAICVFSQIATDLLSTQLQIQARFGLLALVTMAQNALRLIGLGGMALLLGPRMTANIAASCFALASLLIISLSALSIRRFALNQKWIEPKAVPATSEMPSLISVARRSFPFGFAIMFQLVYYQGAIILLKLLSDGREAGYYNVAFVFIAVAYILPNIVFQQFYLPQLHARAFSDPAWTRRFSSRASITIGVVGLLVALVLWTGADFLIVEFIGPAYSPASRIVRILSLGVPAIYVSYSYGAILATKHYMPIKTSILAVVATFSVLMNIWAIPAFGGTGAAWTAVISAWLLLILYFSGARLFLREPEQVQLCNAAD